MPYLDIQGVYLDCPTYFHAKFDHFEKNQTAKAQPLKSTIEKIEDTLFDLEVPINKPLASWSKNF